jgi:hypothetical protein
LRAKKEKRDWREKKREETNKDKTVSGHIQDVQRLCNQYVNLRDRGKHCISCGCSLENRKVNASHFYPTKGYPELRFDLDNIHSSCIPCNQHLHGNLHEYRKRLPDRIGQERFEYLESRKGTIVQYRIPELMALKAIFIKLIKELKDGTERNDRA